MKDTYITFNSKNRIKQTQYNISKDYNVNSINLTQDSNIITINHPDHGFNQNDNIKLQINPNNTYQNLDNPFIFKLYNSQLYVYTYHPNYRNIIDINNNNYAHIQNFHYPQGTANFQVLQNDTIFKIQLDNLTSTNGVTSTDSLIKLNDKIIIHIDSHYNSNDQVFNIIQTNPIVAQRESYTNNIIYEINSYTCTWKSYLPLDYTDNSNNLLQIPRYFDEIPPQQIETITNAEFPNLRNTSDANPELHWYKFKLPVSHGDTGNTNITVNDFPNIMWGGNCQIKFYKDIIYTYKNNLTHNKIFPLSADNQYLYINLPDELTDINQHRYISVNGALPIRGQVNNQTMIFKKFIEI